MARSTKSQNKKKSEGPEKADDVADQVKASPESAIAAHIGLDPAAGADKPVVVQKEVKGSNSDLSKHPKFAKFKQGAKK